MVLTGSLAVAACGGGEEGPVLDAVWDWDSLADGFPRDGHGPRPDAAVPTADASPACVAAAEALAEDIYGAGHLACTVVVRLDFATGAILGHQLVCGNYAAVTEQEARARAGADTGIASSAPRLSPAGAEDAYVFHIPAADDGASAAVAVATGLTVFGGTTVWAGAGDLVWPTTWRPAAALASGCPASGGMGVVRGYDLAAGGPLDGALADVAAGVVAGTAVPAALWGGGYVFSTVVLLYPRSVGVFDPATAEWIVLVNGGWLE